MGESMTPPAAFKPLSKNDVAEILGVSVRTIENHVSAHLLPAPASIGNRRYWHPDVFYGWLEKALHDSGRDSSDAESTEQPGCEEPNSDNGSISRGVPKARKSTQPRERVSSVERARARDKAALKKLEGL